MTKQWIRLTRDSGISVFLRAEVIQGVERPGAPNRNFNACLHLTGGNVMGVRESVAHVLGLLGADEGLDAPPPSRPRPVGSAA